MSENIFSSFYNKVLGFFQKETNQDSETAKDTATNRLKLVLMQDRSNLDGATMQKMREQLISVISKYIEIDQEALDLNLESDGDEIALMLNIPVIRARTKEEIEELEKLEEEASKSKEEQTEEDAESEENEETEESEEQPAEENEAEPVEETQESEEAEDTIVEEASDNNEEETENVEAKDEEASLDDSVQETKKSKKQKNK